MNGEQYVRFDEEFTSRSELATSEVVCIELFGTKTGESILKAVEVDDVVSLNISIGLSGTGGLSVFTCSEFDLAACDQYGQKAKKYSFLYSSENYSFIIPLFIV